MSALAYRDLDPAEWSRTLGISKEAIEVYCASDVIDLHLDSFIWTRIFGYDLRKRHGLGPLGGRFLSQIDFPRVREARLTGGTWVITTNPLRGARGRADAFVRNLARLRRILASAPDEIELVRNVAEYRRARAAGRHAAFVGIQGGNALDVDEAALDRIPDDVVLRVTLVHLSSSRIGSTSAPGGDANRGLSGFGREYVRHLDEKRIFVDLAHINRRGFFDALEAHDRSKPVLVTHTGVTGVHPHWRNIDDEQIRAVAETGGTIGIMYQSSFLGAGERGRRSEAVVDHVAHVIEVAGDAHVSLGSDWDGAITPPDDLKTCTELPRLVEHMLRRGWSAERVQRVLGGNFLRVVESLRG
jgi:membrane dipeptidase